LLLLYSESGSGGLTVFHLALFESEVIFHFVNLLAGWQFVLSCHGLLHMLEKLRNMELIVWNLLFIASLLNFKSFLKFIDFLFFFIENFIFFLIFTYIFFL
jgi:hypothetical protein